MIQGSTLHKLYGHSIDTLSMKLGCIDISLRWFQVPIISTATWRSFDPESCHLRPQTYSKAK